MKDSYYWALGFLTWVCGDFITTLVGMRVGLIEGNPALDGLVSASVMGFLAVKVLAYFTIMYVTEWVAKKAPSEPEYVESLAKATPKVTGVSAFVVGGYITLANIHAILNFI